MHRKSREKHQDKTRNVKLPKLEIKNFSGKLAAWMTFIDSFEATVDRSANLSDVEKFNFFIIIPGKGRSTPAGMPYSENIR